MQKSKIFVKKTKSGGVLKVVREHYLRTDIWCGSSVCKSCHNLEKPVLEGAPNSSTCARLCNFPHYLVPDTNVVLHQIDIIESDPISNVIVLQTVIDEVRHRHVSTYKRIKDLVNNADKHFYIFSNEYHKDTYIERQAGETSNDRNDRAIRTAVKWYKDHLTRSSEKSELAKKVDVVLLTNDKENLLKAQNDGLSAYTVSDYVKSITGHPELQDKLAHTLDNPSTLISDGKCALFREYLTTTEIHSGIKAGHILQGTFLASRENFLEGFVSVQGWERMILIQGSVNMNRAVHDDVVAVQLLPKEEWKAQSQLVLEDDDKDNDEELASVDKILENANKKQTDKQPTGKIVGVIKRNWRQYCGMLLPSAIKEATRHLFVPAEKRIPRIRIETRQAEKLIQQRIIVTIDSWPKNSRYPLGHFVRALGNVGDKETENEVLLLEHDVIHHPFSDSVLACLPKLPWIISDDEIERRTDLRHLVIASVDPPGCTDIDDALHCRELANGNYEVGVHIADVSHFIRPGTALDIEAASRGTTVYLVDKRIDMVPELLSSNLCSLLSNEDRFAFSCIWEVSPKAEIVNTRYIKSIIRSVASLTYAEAQMIIDDPKRTDDLAKSLRGLNRLAKVLKQRRVDNGALLLASPEVRFSVDSETHDPLEVETKQLRETNSMVEEFMLLANISVATKILQDFPDCALLRRHPAPPLSNFDPLIKAAKSKNLDLTVDSGKALADSLVNAVIEDNPFYNTMLRILATRCMMQAVYFCSGTIEESQFFHYGLAAPIYTHFTSPIRRYSDIIAHRLLAVTISADSTYPDLLDKHKTQALCNNLNYRHKMGQYAGRASVNLNTHVFFRNRVQDEEGYVLFVRENALQILIPRFGLEGMIYLKSPVPEKDAVKFVYNEEEPSQTWGDVKFCPFDRVIVQISVDRSNLQHEKLTLKLVEPKIPGFSVPKCEEQLSPPKKKLKKSDM